MAGEKLSKGSEEVLPRPAMLLLAFVAFSMIALVRNAGTLAFPYLYAEDGVWIGHILTRGFWAYAFQGRGDFPVFGLLVLEKFALLLTQAVFANDLSTLPLSVALVASLFLGLVGMLPLLCLADRMPTILCILLGAAITLLPVGQDMDEIFGRILNLGFYMPVVAQFLLFALLYRAMPRWADACLQGTMLLLMWTFPVVIAQYGLFIAFDTWRAVHARRAWMTRTAASGCLLILGAALIGRTAFTQSGGIPLPFRLDGMVEFALARSILFPVVAPFYSRLTDGCTLALVFGLIASGSILGVRAHRQGAGLTDYRLFLVLNFGLMFAATLIGRRGLSSIFDHYRSSFPDRYFTGLNAMALVAAMAAAAGDASLKWRIGIAAAFTMMLASWLILVPLSQTRSKGGAVYALGTLRDTICDQANGTVPPLPSPAPDVVVLPIYPVTEGWPWRMDVPSRRLRTTAELQCNHGRE